MMTTYEYLLNFSSGVEDDGKVRVIEIATEGKDVVTAFGDTPPCCAFNAATDIAHHILRTEWEKIHTTPPVALDEGVDQLDNEEAIPPRLRSKKGGPTFFIHQLRDKLAAYLTKHEKTLLSTLDQHRANEYLSVEWDNTENEDSIYFSVVLATPAYTGEDWHEKAKYPDYRHPLGPGEIAVMYSGVTNQLFVQLLDLGEEEGPGFHYRHARVYFTTNTGKLLSVMLLRHPLSWKLDPIASRDVEDYAKILKESYLSSFELSYFLEAHARHVERICDMPLKYPLYNEEDESIWLDKVAYLTSGIGGLRPKESEECIFIAPGRYRIKVFRDAQNHLPVKLLLALEGYDEDFFHAPPKQAKFASGVEVKACDYFLIWGRGLYDRVGTEEEFLPYLYSRINRKLVRPGICNYFGVGFGVKLISSEQERKVRIDTFEAVTGDKKGKVVAMNITL